MNVSFQKLNTSGFITESDLSGYVTEEELEDKGYLSSADLDNYVTESELENKGYLTSVPYEYVTDSELKTKGYLTNADLSGYATDQELQNAIQNTQRRFVLLTISENLWENNGLVSVSVSGIDNLYGSGNVTPIAFFGDFQNSLGDSYFQAVPMLEENISSFTPCINFAYVENGTLSIKIGDYAELKNLYVLLARTDNFFEG